MGLVIDENLHPNLYSLAWLVGSWSGGGAVQLGEDAESGRRIEQTVTFTPNNDIGVLEYRSEITLLEAPAPEVPELPGTPLEAAPVDAVRLPFSVEQGYWRTAGAVVGPLTGAADTPRESSAAIGPVATHVELLLTQPTGSLEVYVGIADGPRIQLVTDHVFCTASGTSIIAGRRMFGLVNGALMWVYDRQIEGQEEPVSYLSAELQRV